MADTDNLKIQQQINKLLKERQSLLNSIEEQLSTQADTSQKFQDILANASKLKLGDVFSEATEGADGLKKATKSASDQSAIAGQLIKSSMSGTTSVLSGIGKAFGSVGKGAMVFGGVAMGAASLVTGAFSGVLSIISSVAGVIKSVVGAMWNLAKSIIALPFNLLDGLIKMGNELMGIGLDIARAWEDVRDVFGDLSTTVGADIRSTVMNLRMIGDTGLDAYQVLGTMSQRIEAVSKLYQGLGGAVMLFSQEIKNSNGAVIAFQRGLGFTEEQLQGVATMAMSSGKTLVEVQSEIANQSIQLGATFGIPKKLIGKDVAEMINDIDTFGNMTVKQMAKTSVYAKKLGVDVKKMAGVFKAFSNFEDAAIGAAKLSQAFGMNIDAVKQLKAGSPAEIVEDLRSAFFAAGKDAANLNRHELALLATQSGLDQETAKRVFSLENQGVAYEDIANKADDAESAQLTAANAMKQVAKDIKKIVHEVLKMDGAFAEFRKGFEQGFTIMNPKFMNLIKIARDVGFTMRGMGQQFAKAILQLEPVKDVFDGLTDFMKGFTGLLKNVAKEYVLLGKALGKDAEDAGANLVDRLSNVFNNFMNNPKVAGGLKKIKKGISGIAVIVLETLSGMIPKAIKIFRELLDKGTDYLRNPGKLKLEGSAPAWIKSLMKLFNGIKAQGGPLIDSIKGFFGELFKGDFLDKMGITAMVESLGRKMMIGIFRALGTLDLPFADSFNDAADKIENKEKDRARLKKEREQRAHAWRIKNANATGAVADAAAAKTAAAKSKDLKTLKTMYKEQAGLKNIAIEMKDISTEVLKNQKGEIVGHKASLNFSKKNKKHMAMASQMVQKGMMSRKKYAELWKTGTAKVDVTGSFAATGQAAAEGAMKQASVGKELSKKSATAGADEAKLAKLRAKLNLAQAAQDELDAGAGRIDLLGIPLGGNWKKISELEDQANDLAPLMKKIEKLRKKMNLGAPEWTKNPIENKDYFTDARREEEAKRGEFLAEQATKYVAATTGTVQQKTKDLEKALVKVKEATVKAGKAAGSFATQLKPLAKKGVLGANGKLVIQRKDTPVEVVVNVTMDANQVKTAMNLDNATTNKSKKTP